MYVLSVLTQYLILILMHLHKGNIAWAYNMSPATCGNLTIRGLNIPAELKEPRINTRMISFYSNATGRLDHDEFNFFEI